MTTILFYLTGLIISFIILGIKTTGEPEFGDYMLCVLWPIISLIACVKVVGDFFIGVGRFVGGKL